MAKAKLVPTVVLELSDREARALHAVLGSVANGQGTTDNIYRALAEIGISMGTRKFEVSGSGYSPGVLRLEESNG